MTRTRHSSRSALMAPDSADADLDLLYGDLEDHASGVEDDRPTGAAPVITWSWESDYGF